MATAIIRSQVVLAMDSTPCSVPDFITRKKATLVWSKAYVSMQGDRIGFVELNLLERIVRYITRGYWYGDTIIIDKDVLRRIKIMVANIKSSPIYADPVLRLIPKAKHLEDYDCLVAMLRYCISLPQSNHDSQVRADLDRHIRVIESKYGTQDLRMKPRDFSQEFLTAAVALVREKRKKDPKDPLWKTISDCFLSNPLNERVLKEIVGIAPDRDHTRDIVVPSEAQAAFEESLTSIQDDLTKLRAMGSLEENLKTYGELEQFTVRLDSVKQVLAPFLEKPEGKAMIQTLYGKLIQVNPVLVGAYLDGNEMKARRLFDRAAFSDQSCYQWQRISEFVTGMKNRCGEVILQTVNSFTENRVDQHGDTFSESCNQCVKRSDGRSWREVIAEELAHPEYRKPFYQHHIKDRLENDPALSGWTKADYCQKINEPHAPIGYPEWVAFSLLVQAPVVVVTTDGKWKLEHVINPAIRKPAYMFRYWGGLWHSMSRDKKTDSTE